MAEAQAVKSINPQKAALWLAVVKADSEPVSSFSACIQSNAFAVAIGAGPLLAMWVGQWWGDLVLALQAL